MKESEYLLEVVIYGGFLRLRDEFVFVNERRKEGRREKRSEGTTSIKVVKTICTDKALSTT